MSEVANLSPLPKSIQAGGRGQKKRFRGQPIFMLSIVLASWVTGRVMLWEVPSLNAMNSGLVAETQLRGGITGAQNISPLERDDFVPLATVLLPSSKPAREIPVKLAVSFQRPTFSGASLANIRKVQASQKAPLFFPDLQSAASHQLLLSAALAYLPIPTAIGSAFAGTGRDDAASRGALSAPIALTSKSDADRWSLDAWAFWREGSGAEVRTPGGVPTYGASQAGAVLRYAISPNSATRPRAYLRAYSSLQGDTEQEVAAGLSARSLKRLPLRLHVEGRALHSGGQTSARAAAFVTTEIPPVKLPASLRAEVYGQAGYVTGASATPFADGQLHIMREMAGFDLAAAKDTKFKIGAAAFAGAQKGAKRFDIGPSVRLETHIADTPARLSVDWRQRIAGDAEPGSGLALTLSTRF